MPTPLTTHLQRAFHSYLTGEEHAYATTLLAILSYLYGTEYLASTEDNQPWTPEALRIQVKEDTGAEIDDKVMDKIQAAIIAVTDDRVLNDAVIFNNVATALFDMDVLVDEWDEPDPEELAWAAHEILLLRGEDRKDAEILAESISDDVEKYITVTLQRAGFTKPPIGLEFVDLPSVSEDDYSDDPSMFTSVYQEQRRKVDEVNQLIRHNLAQLMSQLRKLEFKGQEDWLNTDRVFENG